MKESSTALCCLVALLGAYLGQDIAAATTIAVKRAADFIVITADSRVTGDDGRPRSYGKCKVSLLDDRSFFASAGVASSKGGGKDSETEFRADQVAKRLYSSSRELKVIVNRWAEVMEEKFTVQQGSWKRAIVNTMKSFQVQDRVFAQGIFGSAHETVAAWETTVKYDETSPTIKFSHLAPQEIDEEEAGIRLWGTASGAAVVSELLQGGTRRAAIWRASIAKEAVDRGYQAADRYAFEMKGALDYAISTGVDTAIGGDVAALILERNRPARWFNKPPVCAD